MKKNGFTLIELLAIIVILAIIAVITVPIILGIIENSRKGAAIDSAYGYKDSVNKYYVIELQNHSKLKLNDTYTVTNGTLSGGSFGDEEITSLSVFVSGTVPSSGKLRYSNNVLNAGCLVIGDYKITFKSDGLIEQTVKGNCENYEFPSENAQGGNEQGNGGSQVGTPLTIGESVTYSTTLNEEILNNWKVFLSDENYTYLIYGDYLPNATISNTIYETYKLNTLGTYTIYADESREDLVSAMTTKSNWDSLLTGTINGHPVNETRTENVWAIGAPTVDLWVNSWNTSYSSDTLYTRYIDTEDIDNNIYIYATGYAIGDSANPTSTYIDLSGKTGYNNILYFPRQEIADNDSVHGYWLASPSAASDNGVMRVYSGGYVSGHDIYNDSDNYAFRPVIKLPTSILNQ